MALSRSLRNPPPKPTTSYAGERDTCTLDNFLWDLEEYFANADISTNAERLRTASTFLTGAAKLWWRRCCSDPAQPRDLSWDGFCASLVAHFFPANSAFSTWEALADLQQMGSPQEYVAAFTTLLLSIQGLSTEQTHFQFLKGLQHWTRQEVDRRGATNFPTMARIVESLQDTRRVPPRTQTTTTPPPPPPGTPALPSTKPVPPPPHHPPPDSSALPPPPTHPPRGASPARATTSASNAPKSLLVTPQNLMPSPPFPRQLIPNYTPSHSTS